MLIFQTAILNYCHNFYSIMHQPDTSTMAGLPFVVVKPNKATQRQRWSSQSSNTSEEDYQSCESSPSVSRDNSPDRGETENIIRLQTAIGSSGGFTHIVSDKGLVKGQIFGFPTRSVTSSQRELLVRELVSKLYSLYSENKDEDINKILKKLAPKDECTKPNLPEKNLAKSLMQNVDVMPSDGFKKPNSELAMSTPGPRLCSVPNIYTPLTAIDSLRVITHLQLSDPRYKFLQQSSLILPAGADHVCPPVFL